MMQPMPPGNPWQRPVVPQSAMRASQADRERTVDVLKAAFAEGRLSTDEYHDRTERAQYAQTYGQLGLLVQDLPVGPMPTPMMAPPPAFAAMPPPAPPYGYVPPGWPPVRRRTNGAATASLLLGLAQLVSVGATGLPALICGVIAKNQLRTRDEEGDGMATAGIILGSLGTVLWAFFFLLAIRHG